MPFTPHHRRALLVNLADAAATKRGWQVRTLASGDPSSLLVDAFILIPNPGRQRTPKIELKGNLAAMLSATQHAKRSPVGDLLLNRPACAKATFICSS